MSIAPRLQLIQVSGSGVNGWLGMTGAAVTESARAYSYSSSKRVRRAILASPAFPVPAYGLGRYTLEVMLILAFNV